MQQSKIKLKQRTEYDISNKEVSDSIELLRSKKVAIFIVAYNAERHLDSLLERIPEQFLPLFAEIFIIDDSSSDLTFDVATRIKDKYQHCNINVYRTPFNRGYGGNQKLGYLYCIENDYDIVVLLHGDGQYAPEYLPKVLASFNEDTSAVFASRMINKSEALRGGMPLYKWFGNQALTHIENKLLGSHLSEFHTGYRAYRVTALRNVPFVHNSDDFHFDTEIIIQLLATKHNIVEVPIPTYYGDEKCHVKSLKYAKDCINSIIRYHLVNVGLFYSRNFDFHLFENDNYRFKKSPYSLHQYILRNILRNRFNRDLVSVELGANRGLLSNHIANRVKEHWAIDIFTPNLAGNAKVLALDLDNAFSNILPQQYFDHCFVLDVIEHLNNPENFLVETFNILKANAKLYISSANIAYLPMRILLSFGQFNYGKRGILDRTHKRLFNVNTLKRLLMSHGFTIDRVVGFGPPLTDLVSKGKFMRFIELIHSFFSRLYPPLFAYNFLIVVTRIDSMDDIFKKTIRSG